jgi:CRP-like cAMP-binding protein
MDTGILLREIQRKSDFKKEDFPALLDLFEQHTFRKDDMLTEKGKVVYRVYFIIRGCIRQFYINDQGKERNVHFITEGKWAGDTMSLMNQTPTNISNQALEDFEAISLNRHNTERAIKEFPGFAWYEYLNRIITIAYFRENVGRETIETPEAKYQRLEREQPHLLQRLPLYHIASYLGVTPETLSRIRKKMSGTIS